MPINRSGATRHIPISKPLLGAEEARAAGEAILSGWVTQGPKVKDFEERFAVMVGARHACAVSSCTTALHLALLGVGVKPGEVVITVSHSFIATANAVRHCGAEPVFVEIDPATYNLDPAGLEQCLREDCRPGEGGLFYSNLDRLARGESSLCHCNQPTGRVAAILAVHQMGMPCDLRKILEIAAEFELPVVEDAACAIGSEISLDEGRTWEKIGKPHGRVACFSFHPRKILTTGDGGMLTTSDPELDRRFRLWRQHGMSVSDMARHRAHEVVFEEYLTTGFNYRLTDIQAAVGIVQLGRLEAMLAERRRLARAYFDGLAGEDRIILPVEPGWAAANWQSFPVRLQGRTAGERNRIMTELLARGIATRRGIMNAHREPPYLAADWQLPASETSSDATVLLPLYNGLTEAEQRLVVSALREVLPS